MNDCIAVTVVILQSVKAIHKHESSCCTAWKTEAAFFSMMAFPETIWPITETIRWLGGIFLYSVHLLSASPLVSFKPELSLKRRCKGIDAITSNLTVLSKHLCRKRMVLCWSSCIPFCMTAFLSCQGAELEEPCCLPRCCLFILTYRMKLKIKKGWGEIGSGWVERNFVILKGNFRPLTRALLVASAVNSVPFEVVLFLLWMWAFLSSPEFAQSKLVAA